MLLANLHSCIRHSSFVNRPFIILLLLVLPLVSCGRYKIRKEREHNQIFAEILKREDRRSIGNDRFFERNLLENRSSEVSGWSAIALGRIGNPDALPLLHRALHSGDASVRAASAFAIGECMERNRSLAPESIRALQSLLEDTSLSVRMRAVEALGKIGSRPEAAEIVRQLEGFSDNGDPYQRAYLGFAITALDRLKNPDAVPILERLANSRDPEIHWRALEALAHLQPAQAVAPLLIKNLRHQNSDVQARAAFLMAEASRQEDKISNKAWTQALRRLGGLEAITQLHQMLQRALDTRNSRAREMAADVLHALAGTGTPVSDGTWSQLLRERDCALLPEAIEINSIFLRSSNTPRAQVVEAFAACNSSSNIPARLRILDRLGLWSQDEGVQQVLLAGLKDPDRRIRYASYEILRNAGLPGLPARPDPGNGTITDPIAQAITATRRNTTIAQVETTHGTMEIELFREDAPVTVHNFVLLAKRGAYDGMELSRMIPFRVEGRIPQSRMILGRSVNSEINMRPFERGSLGMALFEAYGDSGPYGIFGNEYSDAGGFFITLSPQPELDGVHTCFGRIVSGLQIADKIVPGDRIKKIHIKETVHIHDYRKYE